MDNDRSQASDALARLAKSTAHVVGAAAASGPYGAAAAAVEEALPILLKILVGIVAAVLIFLLVIITAIPSMFFGYGNSKLEPVMDMTAKAMTLGGAYVNLEDFEAAQVDAIVTCLVEECEEEGTTIDRVVVMHSFTQEDLIWVIAINSVAYQQNLNIMTPANIQKFVTSHLAYSYGLFSGERTTLHIRFEKLDPKDLMDELGFNEEDRRWAMAIQESLTKSNALTKYEAFFSAYRPNYGGDTPTPGNGEHGSSYSSDIDISRFINPSTKNNHDLVAYAIQAWDNNWGYVWGTYGNILTESLLAYKIEQYPDGVGNYEDFIKSNWLGRRTTDCVGLIKGYGWLDADTLKIKYGTNEMPDYGADAMHQAAVNARTEGEDYGSISTMPEIPGLALWKSGHIGIYIGNGYAIEASSTKTGVIKTKVAGRGWAEWCKIPYINYLEGG